MEALQRHSDDMASWLHARDIEGWQSHVGDMDGWQHYPQEATARPAWHNGCRLEYCDYWECRDEEGDDCEPYRAWVVQGLSSDCSSGMLTPEREEPPSEEEFDLEEATYRHAVDEVLHFLCEFSGFSADLLGRIRMFALAY